jgi:hypothetical protein
MAADGRLLEDPRLRYREISSPVARGRASDREHLLIDESIYHPSDSFTVPPVPVGTLLIPIHAPWSKVSEVLDFTKSTTAC